MFTVTLNTSSRYNKVLFGLLCLLVVSCSSTNKTIQSTDDKEVVNTNLDRYIKNQLDSLNIAGVSISIIQDHKVVFSRSFGVKNLITKKPVTKNTLFEVCSLSKPVFAYFVMLQVEKGVLDLDTPLYTYLINPDIEKNDWHKLITARMVLTHTSGLPNWRDSNNGDLNIHFKPGTEYRYSGEAFQYLKRVLNHLLQVDDKGLEALFQKEMVRPLRIKPMYFTWKDLFSTIKAYGHINKIPTDNGPVLLNDRINTFGAGYSVHATSLAYAKFLTQIMTPKNKNKNVVESLLQPQLDSPIKRGEVPRSLGFPRKQTAKGLKYYHSGNNGDFKAYCEFYKEQGAGFVVLSNSDSFFSSGMVDNLIKYFEKQYL